MLSQWNLQSGSPTTQHIGVYSGTAGWELGWVPHVNNGSQPNSQPNGECQNRPHKVKVLMRGHGGPVVRFRLQCRRSPSSNPIPLKTCNAYGPVAR
ncbi:hypothetical protein AVEN_11367-1 [Araneus ventricosus]|uniref:Uncharacterized protein n=1 Tax=Araneus ventricosus TaxID=182803 RepID=A0A4Y2HCA7_ARAVE|nr:hypothetical protein AVEN_11367-1 [Araneus ventricosus]